MICFPNAKINLGLHVVSKRPDGYHNLETVFYPLKIYDALEIIPGQKAGTDSLEESGYQVHGAPEDNLVMKAVRLMRAYYNFPPLDVYLLKKIPFGAGLGGGSADASFMLKLLNDTFSLGASDNELATLALKLGADCPFFIYNRPLYATGIGELFEPVDVNLQNYYFVLVKPEVHVSTKDAFSGIEPQASQYLPKDIVKQPVEDWKNLLKNDFEKTVFAKYPLIEQIKSELYQQGAVYASMSGSGSSVYGIFEKGHEIKSLSMPYFTLES
ncbi:MAG: 4-(cytidine 5'-diphospho)-2-C-methyl-D-erythritol kinase [Dysgonamonadaceae bacterium]